MAAFHKTLRGLAERKRLLTEAIAARNAFTTVSKACVNMTSLLKIEQYGSSREAETQYVRIAGSASCCGPRSFAATALQDGGSAADGNFESLSRFREVLRGPEAPRSAPAIPLEEQKLLNVSIMGVPNAGKSTLTNRLVGTKVSAVSSKTNTTFEPTLGAYTGGKTQLVFYDTPGVVDSKHYKNPRQIRRVRSAWTTARDCDILLLLIDAHRQIVRSDARVVRLVEEMAAGKQLGEDPPPAILLLNKIDKLETAEQRFKVEKLGLELGNIHSFEETFVLSASQGEGVPELRQSLLARAKPGSWLLEPDQASDLPLSATAAEVVREKVFKRLRQELPYELEIRKIKEQQRVDGSILFKQDILVPTEIVRRMVVGRQGCVVGEIGITARLELERLLQRRVHLYLSVRVRPQ